MKKWKIALSSADTAPATAPILLKGDICSNLRLAAKLGYQGLEIHTRETVSLDYEEIRKVSEGCGVSIVSVVTGRLNTQGQVNLIDDRPYITEAAMRGMYQYIKIAEKLRTNLIVGWIKGRIPDGVNADIYLERLAGNLRMLCEEAKKAGVKVFVEVINRYETNIFTTSSEIVGFLKKWEIPNCYIHLDTFHMSIEETNPIEAIRICGKRLGYFHVADNTRCYPGSGMLDFSSYFTVLEEIGYNGYISVECLPVPDEQTAAQKALSYLRQYAV